MRTNPVNDSIAADQSDDVKTNYSDLTPPQQEVFRDSLGKDQVELSGEFAYDESERGFRLIWYDGQWYFVSVVKY